MDVSSLALPAPEPLLIYPRTSAAYAAVLGAALLGCLYLYRRKRFILYWMVGWLCVGGSMAARGFDPDGRTYGWAIADGLGSLFAVCSAVLLLLAPDAIDRSSVAQRRAGWVFGPLALFSVGAPLIISRPMAAAIGYLTASILLGLAASRYLRLWRSQHSAGAFLIGLGSGGVALSNVGGAAGAASLALSGDVFNVLLAVNVVLNVFVALGMHLFVFEDMTGELRRANANLALANDEVRRLANTDPLTGCHNRHAFDEIERREIQRHRRHGVALSVVFADVNHLKLLNDALGHDLGDDALRRIGTLLRGRVRETDYVIRWGGDEFVLILGCSEAEARAKAAELKQALAMEGLSAAGATVGLSTGVSEVRPDAASLGEALRLADHRMYQEKAATG